MRGRELEAHRAQQQLQKVLKHEQMLLEKGRQAGLVEAAQALDERHRDYFNQPDNASRQIAVGVREASRIVRMIRIEGVNR